METSENPFFYIYSFKKSPIFRSESRNKESSEDLQISEDKLTQKDLSSNMGEKTSNNFLNSQSTDKSKGRLGSRGIDYPVLKTIRDTSYSLKNPLFDFKPYNSLSHMKLSEIALSFRGKLNDDFKLIKTSLKLGFLDPMKYSRMIVEGALTENRFSDFSLIYRYSKYRPSLGFSFNYTNYNFGRDDIQTSPVREDDKTETFFTERYADFLEFLNSNFMKKQILAGIFLTYPLIRRTQWKLYIQTNLELEQFEIYFKNREDHLSSPQPYLFEDKYHFISHGIDITYSYMRRYPYAYHSHSKRGVSLSYNTLLSETGNMLFKGEAQGYFGREIFREFFMNLKGFFLFGAEYPSRYFEGVLPGNNFFKFEMNNLFTSYILYLEFIKVINMSFYSSRIPLAIRRWASILDFSFRAYEEGSSRFISDLSFEPRVAVEIFSDKTYNYDLFSFIGVELDIEFLQLVKGKELKAGFVFDLLNLSTPEFKFNKNSLSFVYGLKLNF